MNLWGKLEFPTDIMKRSSTPQAWEESQQRLDNVCSCTNTSSTTELEPKLTGKLRETVNILEQALLQYGPDKIAVSFDGGKDCTLVLDLYCGVLSRYYKSLNFKQSIEKIKILCVIQHDPFDETEKFVKQAAARYYLELFEVKCSIKEGLTRFKQTYQQVDAIIIGVRRTDPYAEELTPFLPTDKDWPKYMRVNPILEWNYGHIWQYLIHFRIPYCSLYDQGYTSLGSKESTKPNPELEDGHGHYQPAYKLGQFKMERAGRTSPPPTK